MQPPILSLRSGHSASPGWHARLTQHAELEVLGLLPHDVAGNAGVVAGMGQVGLGDPQVGSIWGGVVGISTTQGPAVFEPGDDGLRVA